MQVVSFSFKKKFVALGGINIKNIRKIKIKNDFKSKNINAIYNYNLNIDELERLTFLNKSKNCLDSNNTKIKDIESICNI